jgi:hypothetical protein
MLENILPICHDMNRHVTAWVEPLPSMKTTQKMDTLPFPAPIDLRRKLLELEKIAG